MVDKFWVDCLAALLIGEPFLAGPVSTSATYAFARVMMHFPVRTLLDWDQMLPRWLSLVHLDSPVVTVYAVYDKNYGE